ncbi:MAG: helix-turn-helix domain-containing protein [Peptococcaceae bacterium]|nr:helix-turn-helix domain-containing protein [Peptococcaceae bacterium]
MGRKGKLTWQERLATVMAYLNGEGSYKSIATEYGIEQTTLRRYVAHYRAYGAEGIRPLVTNMHYSLELKCQTVEAYLHGEGSLREICVKFNISDDSVLRSWIKQYNGHNDFRSRNSHRSEINMTKARTTTLE